MHDIGTSLSGRYARMRRFLWQATRRIGPYRLSNSLGTLALFGLLGTFSWTILLPLEASLYDMSALSRAGNIHERDDLLLLISMDNADSGESDTDGLTGSPSLEAVLDAIARQRPRAIGIDLPRESLVGRATEIVEALDETASPVIVEKFSSGTGGIGEPFVQYRMTPSESAAERRFFELAGDRITPAATRIAVDRDGTVRRWPRGDGSAPSMAEAMAGSGSRFAGYDGSLIYRDDPNGDSYRRVSGSQIMLMARRQPARLRALVTGRYVLIYSDAGRPRLRSPLTTDRSLWAFLVGVNMSMRRQYLSRPEVSASQLSQILDGTRLFRLPAWMIVGAGGLFMFVGALSGVATYRNRRLGAGKIAKQELLYLGIPAIMPGVLPPMFIFAGIDTYELPVIGWVVAWTAAYLVFLFLASAYWSDKRLLIQETLKNYLPENVVEGIIAEPESHTLEAQSAELYILFTDLEDFTRMGFGADPAEVGQFLNRYLEELGDIVLAHHGTLDKFVGDAVIAFWGAPNTDPDDARNAFRCALALQACGERISNETHGTLPAAGRTRVGLHKGPAIVGNFGGARRLQYTAIGDTMNTASRIENANKHLGTTVLVSGEAAHAIDPSNLRPMGRVILAGREAAIELFEPVGAGQSPYADQLWRLYRAFDSGDVRALDRLQTLADAHPEDRALARLVDRLRTAGPAGAFALPGK